jgi:hypothetical protein
LTARPPGMYRAHPPEAIGARYVDRAATKADVIAAIYQALDAPAWAAPNLDGLADILRDLSWLPAGPVVLALPEPHGEAAGAIVEVVGRVAAESTASDHPLTVYLTDG